MVKQISNGVNNHDSSTSKAMRTRTLVLSGFVVIGVFFLLTEHRAHTFGFLPYLLLMACPFLHFFMHKNHGGHGGASGRNVQDSNQHNH